MLIIQNEAQKHLMRKFGGKSIFCDTTRGRRDSDFELVLLSDGLDEVITVVCCIVDFSFYGHVFRRSEKQLWICCSEVTYV